MIAALALSLLSAQDLILTPETAPSLETQKVRACMVKALDDPHEALEDGFQWLSQGGQWPAEFCVGFALAQSGQFEYGAARMAAVVEDNVNLPADLKATILTQAGDARVADRDYLAAQDYYDQALSLNNQSAEIWAAAAQNLAEQARWAESLEASQEALALNDQFEMAYVSEIKALIALERLDAAQSRLDAALERDFHSVELLVQLGHLREARRLEAS